MRTNMSYVLRQRMRRASPKELFFYVRYYFWVRHRARHSLSRIDQRRLGELESQLTETNANSPWLKYFDAEFNLKLAWLHVFELNLHHTNQPKHVLDIGTGAGYFPFLLEELGHEAVGADLDTFPVFNSISNELQVDRRIWEVHPFVRAPNFGERFDVVTAFALDFDRAGTTELTRWSVAEWDFFLRNLARDVMTEDGQILLGIKRFKGGTGLNEWDGELFDYFKSVGANLPRKCRVHFGDLSKLRAKGPYN